MLLFPIAGDGHDDRTALTSTVESVARGLLGGINRAVGENIRSARRAFRRRELRRAAGGSAGRRRIRRHKKVCADHAISTFQTMGGGVSEVYTDGGEVSCGAFSSWRS